MSLPRLISRVTSVKPIGIHTLESHRIAFHKRSKKDGSGKCDAFQTDLDTDFIYGVLFEIDQADKAKLDRYEGLGYGYESKPVSVLDGERNLVEAFTYYATDIDSTLLPYTWYLHHVVFGAIAAKLPAQYIAHLEQVSAIKDPDPGREKDELAKYS